MLVQGFSLYHSQCVSGDKTIANEVFAVDYGPDLWTYRQALGSTLSSHALNPVIGVTALGVPTASLEPCL